MVMAAEAVAVAGGGGCGGAGGAPRAPQSSLVLLARWKFPNGRVPRRREMSQPASQEGKRGTSWRAPRCGALRALAAATGRPAAEMRAARTPLLPLALACALAWRPLGARARCGEASAPLTNATSISLTEGGGAVAYQVWLGGEPLEETAVLNAASAEGLNVSPSELFFNASNWDEPQLVFVEAQNDGVASGGWTAAVRTRATGATYAPVGRDTRASVSCARARTPPLPRRPHGRPQKRSPPPILPPPADCTAATGAYLAPCVCVRRRAAQPKLGPPRRRSRPGKKVAPSRTFFARELGINTPPSGRRAAFPGSCSRA